MNFTRQCFYATLSPATMHIARTSYWNKLYSS